MKFGNVKKALFALGAALLISVGIPAVAHADGNTGGWGGGGGGGSTIRSASWVSASGPTGRAYNEFLAKAGSSRSWVESTMRSRGIDVGVCQRATTIWWIYGGGRWVYNWTGATHGGNAHVGGSLENPVAWAGTRPARGEEVNIIKAWAGGRLDATPGPTLLCSYTDPHGWTKRWSNYRDIKGTDWRDTKNSFSKTGTYAYSTTISPMKIEGSYVGNGDWEAQAASVKKTEFGKLYDSVAAGKNTISYDDAVNRVNDASNRDNTSSQQPMVDLSEKNQKAFAKGGIINVSEFKTTATIVATRTNTYRNDWRQGQKRDCWENVTWNQAKGGWNYHGAHCGGWYNNGGRANNERLDHVSNNLTKNMQTQRNVAFWQLISVHCNAADFSALVSATNADRISDVENEDGLNGAFSAVARSRTYDSQPTHLDFGDKYNPNAAAAKSGTMGFFDKECPFDCTASSKPSDGASDTNGATKNSGADGATDGNKNGAVASDQRGNRFTFFRDNDPKALTVDVWYPKSSEGVDYKSSPSAAITTTVTRWAEGTPGTQTSQGGKFTMKTKDGATLFSGNSEALTQKNWDTTVFSNANSTILTGLHNAFTVQASWPSEDGKPQVLNVKYEYAPNVSTSFPTKLGFFSSRDHGNAVWGSEKNVATAIQGKCYANFGIDTNEGAVKKFNDYTGSGTSNEMDKGPVDGASIGNGNANVKSNLVLQFVRATTE